MRPLPHQKDFHLDPHQIKGNFGGFGTGKSLASIQEVMKHLLITPQAHFMVTANISYQYEQTFKKEFERDIPKAFVLDYSIRHQTMLLHNHALLSYRPLDDAKKLRSNNLTGFLVIEGSETKAEGFHELKTRMRNTAATTQALDEEGYPLFRHSPDGSPIPVIAHDWRKGIVESNPDAGWIKTDLLLVSDEIFYSGKILEDHNEEINPDDKDPLISSHIASTHVNSYLPTNYIEMVTKNKPDWWVNRYIRSSFMYAEGLVYPKARTAIVPSFPVPTSWKRIVAFDYGLHDNACFLFGAIDDDNGILYFYKEVVLNNANIEEIATVFKEASKDVPIGGWYCSPIIDAKSNNRDYNKKDLATHFREYGIYFKPSQINLDARIMRLNTYFETGRAKIFSTCSYFINEILNYKFEERTLDDAKKKIKPRDLNNHAVNPAEWIVMELPVNPANLQYGVYDNRGRELTREEKEYEATPWQLRDEIKEEVNYGDFNRAYDW